METQTLLGLKAIAEAVTNSMVPLAAASGLTVALLEAFKKLFTQSLALCAQAGLVSLGRVALDGSKVRASASRHRAMSYAGWCGPKVSSPPRLRRYWPARR